MPDPTSPTLAELADAAFRQMAVNLVRRARQNGTPLILWKDGKVQAVPPESIDLRDEGSTPDVIPAAVPEIE